MSPISNYYFRIKLPQDEAINRLCKWMEKNPKEVIETSLSNAISSAGENGHSKGKAVYVYHNADWTVFEDLSEDFSFLYANISADDWLQFAGKDSLIAAGYEYGLVSAELIVIENNTIIRDFFELGDRPEEFRNIGIAPFERENPIKSWVDLISFVDNDDIVISDNGTVLIF